MHILSTRVSRRVLTHLSERPLSYQGIDLIAVHPLLPVFDDVVIVVIVVAIVEDLPLLLVAGVLALTLLVSALLLCIINL